MKQDFNIDIATGNSRLSKKWKNKSVKWSDLVAKCSETKRTGESVGEYAKMSREEQSNIKDVGGFVGGYLSGGSRKGGCTMWRSIATLDIDYGTPDVWDDFTMQFNFAAFMYSTHKHTKETPRYRLVFPFSRNVRPDEYEPVCRKIAEALGIDLFDITTYQLQRLFYWPSTSRDGEFVFESQDGPACDVDEVLSSYVDYKDVSQWPMSSRESDAIAHEVKKAGDPTEKPGIIGAFCRTYTIEEAIEKFLPDAYEKTAVDGRYTYRKGSVAAGLVCYDGKFAYSHHETDPASKQLCNAFDLCRIHLYGIYDEGSRAEDVTKRPSYAKMSEFVAADKDTRILLTKERKQSAKSDFDGIDLSDDGDEEWMGRLERTNNGIIKKTPKTLRLIMQHDKQFKMVRFNTFSQTDTISDPKCLFVGTHGSTDVDDSSLTRMCAYLYDAYGIDLNVNVLSDKMLKPTAPERGYNPIKEYIEKEDWDGVPRVERLLTDYLGADDTELNRAVIRKWMAGAVGRAIDIDEDTGEGIKFDYCLVLYGEQGTGKSTFAETLAGRWRGAISLADGRKEQCETLQKSWIVEVPEFKGMRTADMNNVKDLISRRSDDFRAAYARTWNKNPRHSVLIGSTNDQYFLKDVTGNRRFWVVKVRGSGEVAEWSRKLRSEISQIWAEALHIYRAGEPLMLPANLEKEMAYRAEDYSETTGDPLRDYLADWLEILLPADWNTYEPKKKVDYYKYYDPLNPTGSVERTSVGISEIITGCSYPGVSKYSPQRIGAILKSLGWECAGRSRGVGAVRGIDGKKAKTTIYVRPTSEAGKMDDDEI